MSYRAIERRLAELERQAPPIVPEPDPEAERAAQWAWAAEQLAGYVGERRGYRFLEPAAATKAWNWIEERRRTHYGYRIDETAAMIVQDVNRLLAEYGEAAVRAEPLAGPVLDLVPEARACLAMDGWYAA